MLISFKEKGEIQSIHNVNDTTPPAPLTDVATFGFFKTSTRKKKKQNRGKKG